jgi:hypothetical protein
MGTLLDPNVVLHRLSEMSVPPGSETSLIRVISGTPSAVSAWKAAANEYINRSLSLDYSSNTDEEDIGWMYAPLLMWPSDNSRWISDILQSLDEFETVLSIPLAYAELKTAVEAWVSSYYPSGTPNYYMMQAKGGAAVRVPVITEANDTNVLPSNYVDDTAVG